ncbi:hypothetical protein ACQCX2_01490 [Propionibacteriaceae bacterium Y1700]|uniref:hypothetical protein n=1 Tax=Microlunatus sp. Y1700 TaxID=3418487 RepID=UPI003DA7643C
MDTSADSDESLFGVRHELDGSITAGDPIIDLDPEARLTGVRCGQRTRTVSADGQVTAEE